MTNLVSRADAPERLLKVQYIALSVCNLLNTVAFIFSLCFSLYSKFQKDPKLAKVVALYTTYFLLKCVSRRKFSKFNISHVCLTIGYWTFSTQFGVTLYTRDLDPSNDGVELQCQCAASHVTYVGSTDDGLEPGPTETVDSESRSWDGDPGLQSRVPGQVCSIM